LRKQQICGLVHSWLISAMASRKFSSVKAIPDSYARWTFVALAWLCVAGVVLQLFSIGMVFLAGQGLWLEHHRLIGQLTGIAVLLLPVVALAGRMGRPLLVASIALSVLFVLQYAFIEAAGGSILRALHAVNALAIFWLATTAAQWAHQLPAREA
jgi:hypothetical protein